MPLTESEKARRRELENQGYTGRNNSELNDLNRGLTDGQSNEELLARCRSGKPDGQARAALRQRGFNV